MLMGGKKKLSLTQMERMQRRLEEKRKGSRREARSRASQASKRPAGIVAPDPRDKTVIDEIKKMKVLTPYTIASRFNIRLSIAKDFLERLHQRGIVTYVSGGRKIRIYTPAD